MNDHLLTEMNDELTIEEQIDYQAEYMHELTEHQKEQVINNRIAQKLLTEQERKLGIQSKYTARPLPGENNDERWICLKAHFQDNKACHMNLLFGSTDGIHGSNTTLTDLTDAEKYHQENEIDISHDEAFTILIIQPRVVRITYGTVGIRSDADIQWLRDIIAQSIRALAEAQKDNIIVRTQQEYIAITENTQKDLIRKNTKYLALCTLVPNRQTGLINRTATGIRQQILKNSEQTLKKYEPFDLTLISELMLEEVENGLVHKHLNDNVFYIRVEDVEKVYALHPKS